MGYSRQAYYKPQVLKRSLKGLEADLKQRVLRIRKDCPGKGCRAIYNDHLKSFPLGRDRSEELMKKLNLNLPKRNKYIRSTESGLRLFDNLLKNRRVTAINQVWQSDMTMIRYKFKWYYLIFITDVYSQRVVGWGAYERAYAENFMEVLKQAINLRKKEGYSLKDMVHHSDGGKQYEAGCYREVCDKYEIKQSMCFYSWENPYAEKTNDLIKNRYLKYWSPENLIKVRSCLEKAIRDHNVNQKKKGLGRLTPVEYERHIQHINQRDTQRILNLKPSNPRQKKNKSKFVYNQDLKVST